MESLSPDPDSGIVANGRSFSSCDPVAFAGVFVPTLGGDCARGAVRAANRIL
jgi:hypothetical protein